MANLKVISINDADADSIPIWMKEFGHLRRRFGSTLGFGFGWLSNADEFSNGTIKLADTDMDGLSDYEKLNTLGSVH